MTVAATSVRARPPDAPVVALTHATAMPPVLTVRFPARSVAAHWLATGHDRGQVLRLVASASSGLAESRIQTNHRRGLPLLLDWLEEQPGDTWQQRWLASGADAAGDDWATGPGRWLKRGGRYSVGRLELMSSSLMVLVGADVVRPSLAWLLTGGKKRKLARNMIRARDREGFANLGRGFWTPRPPPGSSMRASGSSGIRCRQCLKAGNARQISWLTSTAHETCPSFLTPFLATAGPAERAGSWDAATWWRRCAYSWRRSPGALRSGLRAALPGLLGLASVVTPDDTLNPGPQWIWRHRDLRPSNVLSGPGFTLVDWENAGPCTPERELAAALLAWHVDDATTARTLIAYRRAGGPVAELSPAAFSMAAAVAVAVAVNYAYIQARAAPDDGLGPDDRHHAGRECSHALTSLPSPDLFEVLRSTANDVLRRTVVA